MKDFTASVGFILFFLVMVVAITVIAGEKITQVFLWLVLLGMIITNPDKFTTFISRFSTPPTLTGSGKGGGRPATHRPY